MTQRRPSKKHYQHHRKPEKKPPFWKHWRVLLVLLLVLAVAFVLVMRLPGFQIRTMNIQEPDVLRVQEIQQSTQQYFAANGKFLLIPRTNIIFFDSEKLNLHLRQSLPSIEEAKVKIATDRNLEINVIERKPEFLWCITNPLSDIESCYFIDTTGFVFRLAPNFSDGVYLKIFDERDTVNFDPLRTYPVDRQTLEYFKSIRTALADRDIEVVRFTVISEQRVSISLDRISGTRIPSSSRIIITPGLSADNIAAQLRLVQNLPKFQQKLRSQPQGLEYIDLRFANKIFYKFSSDNSEQTEQ
jgi:cell division septal protein FtsQ